MQADPRPDRLLFTPGPITTSRAVKEVMLRDVGSRDGEFIACVQRIRDQLLALAGVSRDAGYETVLMQGSGTYAVEAVVSSTLPRDGRLLVLVNGAYGERIASMARCHGIPFDLLRCEENELPSLDALDQTLSQDARITHVAAVHCETTSGIMNPLEEIAAVVEGHHRELIVDAMSSFGAVPLSLAEVPIDYLISSANKCIEGVPGFAFVIARRESLLRTAGRARTLSLDLLGQWKGFETDGQFRFTPPTHVVSAFEQALKELEEEGGVAGRAARYGANHAALLRGMKALGFKPYLPAEVQGCVITTFHHPADPGFVFAEFYRRLSERGFVIYPGKLTKVDGFRIGNIGRLFPNDIRALLDAIRLVLVEMGLPVPIVT